MLRISAMILALALVSACGGGGGSNPLQNTEEEETDTDTGTDTEDDADPIGGDRTLPPGTASPTPDTAIVRVEADDGEGAGVATGYDYDSATDTFYVDNLAFDGDNTYSRGTAVSSLAPNIAVYESDAPGIDPISGLQHDDAEYRAVYGVSDTGTTKFAIVRPAGYNDFGFRGYTYEREGSVTLPTDIQATYIGDYGGVRVYEGTTGLDYVTGTAVMSVDFNDFNQAPGVSLYVVDRHLYDINGNDVTTEYLDALMAANTQGVRPTNGLGQDNLPDINPVIRIDAADTNGEVTSEVFTLLELDNGSTTNLSSGNYYAIMAGDGASEIVGIVVMTGTDPRNSTSFEETGGFIVTR